MKKLAELNDLPFICEMLYRNTGLSIHWVGFNSNAYEQFPAFIREHPLREKHITFSMLHEMAVNLKSDFPNILLVSQVEYYVYLEVKHLNITIIIGPSILEAITSNTFYQLLRTWKIPMKWKDRLRDYLTSLPVKNQQKLANISQLLYFLLYRKQLSLDEFYSKNKVLLHHEVNQTDLNLFLSKQRLNENFHHDTTFEKTLIGYVKKGQTDEISKFFRKRPPLAGTGVLAKDNQIRSLKNLLITIVTLAGRAAIDAGLHYEIAYSISDRFVQNIEEIDNLDDWYIYSHEIFYEFANRVKQLNQQIYSRPVVQVQQYIFNRLYGKLPLSEISHHVGLNPNYLSRLFKNETGMTITDYILEEKIKEACLWLQNSDMSIIDIASQLNFSDQSYFIKVFKRNRRMTPKQYRLKYC